MDAPTEIEEVATDIRKVKAGLEELTGCLKTISVKLLSDDFERCPSLTTQLSFLSGTLLHEKATLEAEAKEERLRTEAKAPSPG